MELTAAGLAATCLMLVVLVLCGGSLVRSSTDLVLVYLLVFTQFYALRPVLFVLGLDTPSPDAEFFAADTAHVLTVTVLGVTAFLALALLGVWAWWRSGLPGWGPCFVTRAPDLGRLARATVALTAVSVLITGWLVASQGGLGNLIAAAKFDQALAGLFVLRVAPSIGAVVAVSTFLEAHSRGARRVALLGLACAIANAFAVFAWGSRGVLVVIGAVVVLGLRRRRAAVTERHTGRSSGRGTIVLRLALAAVMVVALAGGMRMLRDTLTQGEVLDVYADAGTARQVSLATNATYFDAAMLGFRDWPERHDYRDGADFATGMIAFVPRRLWAGKPDSIAPGRWFRQVYQPDKANGWPMGAAGLWYLNFGWLGLALGGLLSGFALGALSRAQRAAPDHGFNAGVSVMVGVFVVGLGWDADSLLRTAIWIGPLWLLSRYLAPERSRPEPAPPLPNPSVLPR